MHRTALLFVLSLTVASAQSNRDYYRYPSIHGDRILFTAEGDLWETGIEGGDARRLTTHPGEETRAVVSPDGKTIVFSADYEGPTEVYTMPASGGLPARRTFDGGGAYAVGWTPDGKVLYTTRRYSTLPDTQLATIDAQNHIELVPLSQASQAAFDAVWSAMLESDPVGATWGMGVRRAPQVTNWGWTTAVVAAMRTPTLMVTGEHDKQVLPTRVRDFSRGAA